MSILCHVLVCALCVMLLLFFFKQKTAYEMRISDWSSDVCSSDLIGLLQRIGEGGDVAVADRSADHRNVAIAEARSVSARREFGGGRLPGLLAIGTIVDDHPEALDGRSEEHTSELQSLMRISYAVFCLKKKTTPEHTNNRRKR